MKCRWVSKRLTAYLDGETPARERAAIADHLANCPRCREQADDLRKADSALRTLAMVETAPDLTADLWARIALPQARPLRYTWAGAGLAALALLLAASLFLLRPSRQTPSIAPAAPRDVQIAAPPLSPEPSPPPAALVEEPLQQPAAPSSPARAPRRVVRRPVTSVTPAPQEQPSDIQPAPQAEDLSPQPVVAQVRDEIQGVILLVGRPEPLMASSSYYVSVSLPTGEQSIREESIQRDSTGRPAAVRITYSQISPASQTTHQGG
jgi:hypothetical protein